MEDRESPVLYLEMTEATPEEYARSRVPEVRELPGVESLLRWLHGFLLHAHRAQRLPLLHLHGRVVEMHELPGQRTLLGGGSPLLHRLQPAAERELSRRLPLRVQQLLVPAGMLQCLQVRPVPSGGAQGHRHRLPGHQVRESMHPVFVLQLHLQAGQLHLFPRGGCHLPGRVNERPSSVRRPK